MKLKNKFFKLALLASIYPTALYAQDATQIQQAYDTKPVEGLTINGQQEQAVTQPVQSLQAQPDYLQLPKSLQPYALPAQVQEQVLPVKQTVQAPQPLDIKPQMATPDKILSPQVLNKDKEFAEVSFKKQFDNTTVNSLTMEALLSEAYSKNPAVRSARDGLKTVDEQLNQAYSGFLPNLSYSITNTREESNFNGGADKTFYPNSNSLNLRQGIFGGGETYYAVKSAEARVTAAQNELKSTEQEFLFNAITSYIEYIYTQKVLKLAQNNEGVLQEQLKSSRDRFVVGDATKTDVAQSEARLANATSNRVIAEGEFINAKANFKKFFGSDAPETLPMPSSLPDIPESLEATIDSSVKNNPQVNQTKYLLESRDNDINVQESQLLPQLDLNGSVSTSDSVSTTGMFEKESQDVGVTLTVPIYNQGITYSRTREARDRRNQAKQQYNDATNNVRSAAIQAWQKIQTTRSNIDATKASLVASEFALEGVREEQKEGARTVLDVLDAEQERFAAETTHARAIKDSVLAIYNLKLVLGELNPSQLNLSVPEYDPQVHYKNTRFKLIGL